jgi:hypothetical protein
VRFTEINLFGAYAPIGEYSLDASLPLSPTQEITRRRQSFFRSLLGPSKPANPQH